MRIFGYFSSLDSKSNNQNRASVSYWPENFFSGQWSEAYEIDSRFCKRKSPDSLSRFPYWFLKFAVKISSRFAALVWTFEDGFMNTPHRVPLMIIAEPRLIEGYQMMPMSCFLLSVIQIAAKSHVEAIAFKPLNWLSLRIPSLALPTSYHFVHEDVEISHSLNRRAASLGKC